jgi:antitoxin (DNA-binding transcriptional repressor) of toxin-antitoxin stability system
MPTVNLADAKARLSELADRAANGESIVITRRGRPVLELRKPVDARRRVDLAAMQRLTSSMPQQQTPASRFIRQLRDEARY